MPMERVRFGSEVQQNLPAYGRADRPSAATQGAFRQELVKAQSGELNQRIEQALHEIGALGARLAVTQSLADLKRYRQAVGMLLHDLTNHTFHVQAETDWDPQTWEQRSMVILRKVNEELEQLTSMILAEEKDHLAILAKIDEIRGLLLDMRM